MNTTRHDFERRVEANGIALKNVPNAQVTDGSFHIADYVAKNVSSWMMVPAEPDEVDVEAVADDAFAPYDELAAYYDEISVEYTEDEMYWCNVSVEIPDDAQRAEVLAAAVADAVFDRQQV